MIRKKTSVISLDWQQHSEHECGIHESEQYT